MLCEDAKMESEDLWVNYMPKIVSYELGEVSFTLIANDGTRFLFEQEGDISAEFAILKATINDWTDQPVLVVTSPYPDSNLTPEKITPNLSTTNEQTVSQSLINTFFENQESGQFKFPINEFNTITAEELQSYFTIGEDQGWQTIDAIFPNTELIITPYPIGQEGDQALFYYTIKTRDYSAGYISIRIGDRDWLPNSTSQIWQK